MKPVILAAFSNDINNALLSLFAEEAGIRKQLSPLVAADLCELVILEQADTQQILDAFNTYKNRIAIFHFAGHAEAYTLQLENAAGEVESANAQGFAEFLKFQSGLQLVFLNACSTASQVDDLIAANVSAVIATSKKIDEGVATFFSINFYQALGAGSSISKSFLEASAAVRMRYGDADAQKTDNYWADKHHEASLPWNIYFARGGDIARDFSIPAAAGNPLFGLPELQNTNLPARPFKFFKYFTPDDALIFFGRSKEIRQLYDIINDSERARVIHLYGRSGVGKSSLLAAGVLPRVRLIHEIKYVRARLDEPILITIAREMSCKPTIEDIHTTWRTIEKGVKRPFTLLVDQFENVINYDNSKEISEHGNFDAKSSSKYIELDKLVKYLHELNKKNIQPEGKLIISYRKEYLAEIESRFYTGKVDYEKVFLDTLDYNAIEDAISGITKNSTTKSFYCIEIEPGLADRIASDLLREKDFLVAPILQVLLSKMWQAVEAEKIRKFSLDLYLRLRDQGILLSDFIDQRIKKLEVSHAEQIRSGLILDILHYHSSRHGTAERRLLAEITEAYSHIPASINEIVELLVKHYLLVKINGKIPSYQLAHDILAPVIINKYLHSRLPAQRASRILRHHLKEIEGEGENRPLSPADLTIVLSGLSGMRKVSPQGEYLIETSKSIIKRREFRRKTQVGGVVILVIAVLGLFFYNQQISLDKAQAELISMETRAKIAEQEIALRSVYPLVW